MTRRWSLLALALVGGCGYFNALYNAQRSFDEAERAAARGEETRAATRYEEAIEQAAVSYRGHPDGRWADDALYLIVRARFGRGEYREAAVAAERLAVVAQDEETRLGAGAYRGAALVRLDSAALALPRLDTVVAAVATDRPLGAFARLWRARARFALDQDAGAWADLDEARHGPAALAVDAMLEAATHALLDSDSTRLRDATAGLLARSDASLRRDSITSLVEGAAELWGPAFGASVLDVATQWRPGAADSVAIVEAGLRGDAGAVDSALVTLETIYERSGGATGSAARRAAARLMLARGRSEDLERARAVLLPAVLDPAARDLVRDMQVVALLAVRGRTGQPLALFAAAEHARERMRARALARGLYLEYADLAPTSEWAPKALLAALALVDDEAQRAQLMERLRAAPSNVYVEAYAGRPDEGALHAAEDRLARVVGTLREAAVQEAGRRDIAIDRAVAVVDSLEGVAYTDSMTLVCGAYVDSLALVGIRADSVRAACTRADSARVQAVLVIDTMELVDTTTARPDSADDVLRMRSDTGPDTMRLR